MSGMTKAGRAKRVVAGVVVVASVAGAPVAFGAAPPRYFAILVEGPPGCERASASAVNDAGYLGGSCADQTLSQFAAVVWHEGVPSDYALGEPWDRAQVYGVNAWGEAAGSVTDLDTQEVRAARWSGGQMVLLDRLHAGSPAVARAYAIHDSGVAAGEERVDGVTTAVRWRQDGSVEALGSLGGGTSSAAAILSDGLVVGGATDRAGDLRVFLWDDGVMGDITPGDVPGLLGRVVDANESLDVLMQVYLVDEELRLGARTTPHGVEILWPAPGWPESFPAAMNGRGDAVGVSSAVGEDPRATVWLDGRAWLLDDVIVGETLAPLAWAQDISDAGVIAALAVAGDQAWGYILEPVCAADFNADGLVDTRDVVGFLNAWAAGDERADTNGDGQIDSRDVIAYLNAWAAGC
jgi:probable HAF family extracellular repeat protein